MNKFFGLMVLCSVILFGLASMPGCKKEPPTKTATEDTPEEQPTTPADTGKSDKPTPVAADAFFNGSNLNGWKGDRAFWTVSDGNIVGNMAAKDSDAAKGKKGGTSTALYSERNYADFELKVEVKTAGAKANSAIVIRGKVDDPSTYLVSGPKSPINTKQFGNLVIQKGAAGGAGGKKATDKGAAKGAAKGTGKAAKGDAKKFEAPTLRQEFNDVEIKCVDKHVTIKVNNKITIDEDYPTLPESGVIAFQMTASDMQVIFRNIHFTDLGKK